MCGRGSRYGGGSGFEFDFDFEIRVLMLRRVEMSGMVTILCDLYGL